MTNELPTEQQSRLERHSSKVDHTSDDKIAKPQGPRWLKLTIRIGIPILCLFMIFIGMYIGYVVVGNQPSADIFEISTWKQVFDLMFSGY